LPEILTFQFLKAECSKRTLNFTFNNMICKIMSISDIFTVRAVLGSGLSAVASSDGFYVDLTPPVFDPDAMTQIYYDVSQGEFTPVKYQASNNTIKAIWFCYDKQSMVKVGI